MAPLPRLLLLATLLLLPARAVCGAPLAGAHWKVECGGECELSELGAVDEGAHLDVARLCGGGGADAASALYQCNRSLAPACDAVCGEPALGAYVARVMQSNPFFECGPSRSERCPANVVPQTDLSRERSLVFVSQRQALYVALRLLALKAAAAAAAAAGGRRVQQVRSALEYGLTRGCNYPVPLPAVALPEDAEDCREHPWPYSGVGRAGVQGNVFALLAWARALALENAGCDEADAEGRWCPHDSALAAVRGGDSGPDALRDLTARSAQGAPSFWDAVANRPLGRPNVCHFEASRWLWRSSRGGSGSDAGAEAKAEAEADEHFCRGAEDVPAVYGPAVSDFIAQIVRSRSPSTSRARSLAGGSAPPAATRMRRRTSPRPHFTQRRPR